MSPTDSELEGSEGGGEQLPTESSREESDLPARRPPSAAAITREQLERVIRRASDLQFRRSTSVGDSLRPGDVVQIGAEVGIDERYVRQALAEVQAASLLPAAPEDEGFIRKLVGSATVRASRVVPGDQRHVEHNLEGYLKERELLKQVRSRPGRSLWEPAGGVVSSMRRVMDVRGHGYVLARARNVQVAVEPLESGWSLVTFTADIGNLRNERAGGWFAGLGLGGLGAGIGLALLSTGGAILPVLGGIAIVSGSLGIATVVSRSDMRKQHQRMELALQGLLDRLERGESLHQDAEPWLRGLLG